MSDTELIKVGDFVTRLGMGDIHIVTYLSQTNDKQCDVTLGTFVCIKQDNCVYEGKTKPVFTLGSVESNILRRYTKLSQILIYEKKSFKERL